MERNGDVRLETGKDGISVCKLSLHEDEPEF